MLEFIKMFGLGIIYTILSPVILVFFLLFVVYSIINYLVCEAIYLSGFFFGKKFSEHTQLDKTLIRKRKEREEAIEAQISMENNLSNDNIEVDNEGGDLNV